MTTVKDQLPSTKDGRSVWKQGRLPGVGGLVTLPTGLIAGQPNKTTSMRRKKQPSSPPRGGMEEGPIRTDLTDTNGTDTTKKDSQVLLMWMDEDNNTHRLEAPPVVKRVSIG